MNSPRKISLSLAAFVIVCFFLPWVELSCLGVRDSLSGYDLARAGDRLLWLVPAIMLVLILLAVWRLIWERLPAIPALAMTVGGAISAFLMYRERASTDHPAQLVVPQWTAFFWLGFLACLGLVAAGFASYVRRSRSP